MGVFTTINDGTAYYQNITYSGNGNTNRSITYTGNSNMQPDLLFGRKTNAAGDSWYWVNSITGASERIMSDNANAQDSNGLVSFNSDGFSVNGNVNANTNGQSYINHGFHAAGSNTSNSDGSITANIRANTTSKFSIIRYTGNGSAGATIGHGLGVIPDTIFIKITSSADDWACWHKNLGGATLRLNSNTGENSSKWGSFFNSTVPGSSTITLGGDNQVNGSGKQYICFAWAEVQGFSKFGTYQGNGDSNGPMVYTGFKPSMVISKVVNSDSTGNWRINNQASDGGVNVIDIGNNLNENVADFTQNSFDFLSNGFKVRDSAGSNTNNKSFCYWAWGTRPCVSASGTPETTF
jgi:hypothetical protein